MSHDISHKRPTFVYPARYVQLLKICESNLSSCLIAPRLTADRSSPFVVGAISVLSEGSNRGAGLLICIKLNSPSDSSHL